MFERILVTMDMSEMGKTVFEAALSLIQHNSADLLLLHVLSSEEDNSPLPVPPDLKEIYPAQGNDLTLESWRKQWQDFEQKGLEMLKNHSQQATDLGINTDYKQVYGNPARRICQIARQWNANLIVIGRRGRSGLSEILLGSVSNYVLHHAPCSVLIVQDQHHAN
jgi:nucleotide-binding universal stress UspA family protein